jgi:AAA+ ATPase superfamily predicted ATPase
MTSKEHTELIENAMIRGDDFVKNSLVIGASKEAADKYLLNPNNLDADGEWEFIDYEKTDSEVYSSFLAFLVDSEKVYRTSISEMDSEEYFDPFND